MDIEKLRKEFKFRTARSSGAGGQHVNKVETKVEVRLEVNTSEALSEPEKQKIFSELSSLVNKAGELKVVSQEKRTQILNKTAALKKIETLIVNALKPKKKRKYKAIKANGKVRLDNKKRQSEKKALRKKPLV